MEPILTLPLAEPEPEPYSGDFTYWNRRWRGRHGRRAGQGSVGRLMAAKAHRVNRVIAELGVRSVVDLGCGDGRIAELLSVERYLGLDLAPAAVMRAYERFGAEDGRDFGLYLPGMFGGADHYDLAISLDVLMHITDDEEYEEYLRDLHEAARYVLIYAPRVWPEPEPPPHIRAECIFVPQMLAFHRALDAQQIPVDYPYIKGDPDTTPCSWHLFMRPSV